MKKALLLGAGLVSKPIVDYLLSKEDIEVTVASRTVSKAEALVGSHPRGTALPLNVKDDDALEKLVAEHDIVISLVPYIYHVKVARLAIKHKKNMVTTSYISQEMRDLDTEAKDAGIIILNEIGLDPGIDHMSAMKIIHDVENRGGKVVSFRSYCGGLPAPEANTNPWGYKFSWSPRGVVLAARNTGKFLWEGEVKEIPSEKLFATTHKLHVDPVGDFEAYPNRDSMGYIDLYGLHDTRTMYRGTLRNFGWCPLWQKIGALGILDLAEKSFAGMTYKAYMASLVGCSASDDVRAKTAGYLGIPVDAPEIEKLAWLGLFEDTPIPGNPPTTLDVLADALLIKLTFEEGERDMIVLHHEFLAEIDGKEKRITSTMIDYGIPNGDSAMSRTVSLPAAIGTHLILEGKIQAKGVHLPILPNIYNPVLTELESLNIRCEEKYYD